MTTATRPSRFRKLPVVITAIDWTGHNHDQVAAFLGGDFIGLRGTYVGIRTLEGDFWAPVGWKILRGVRGEHYAVEPTIFADTYEPAEDTA